MDDTEFDAFVSSLDNRLKGQGVSIRARPFLALTEASNDLKKSIMFDDEIAVRIRGWFESMYGDRLVGDMILGRSVVSIKGDAYAVRIPVLYGQNEVDTLDWVEGLTTAMRERLSPDESDATRITIGQLLRGYNLKSHLPNEARSWSDVNNAVQSILGSPPNYGISRFASLQAAEKALKAFIIAHGGKPPTGGPQGHNLEGLRIMAESFAIPSLPHQNYRFPVNLVTPITCSASARYPGDTSTLDQAIAAHHASVELCAYLVSHANFIDRT